MDAAIQQQQIMGNQIVVRDNSVDSSDADHAAEYTGGVSATMTAATRVVQVVLEQLAQKDSPPMSEPALPIQRVVSPLSKSDASVSNMSIDHSVMSESIPGAASFETSDSSVWEYGKKEMLILEGGPTQHYPDNHPVSRYRKLYFDRLAKQDKLGQNSLEALCEWTLDIFEVDSHQKQLQVKTDVETRPMPHTTTNLNNKRAWRRKKNSAAPYKDDIDKGTQIRLQMFGSEYARHLSNAAFHRPTFKKKKRRYHASKLSGKSTFLDEASPAVQAGALLDVVVTPDDQPPPSGYYRIRQGDSPFQISRGKHVWHLDVKKEANWDKAAQRPCITALTIIFPDRNEFIPPGFSVVRDGKVRKGQKNDENTGQPADIGTTERVYLCFRRSREGNPLTGLVPLCPAAGELVPEGYSVVERTPRNFVADLNHGATTKPMFLAIRQRLANLEALRPLPFVMSIKERPKPEESSVFRYQKQNSVSLDESGGGMEVKGYYATSGSIVPADVGRFHILDRSTHNMLSPSSVSNRLSLIEKSKIKAGKSHESISVPGSPLDPNKFSRDFDLDNIRNAAQIRRERENYALPQSVFPEDDVEFRHLLETLDFIPGIEVAAKREARGGALLRLQARTTLLVPILTACYNRHGGGALTAVEGLHRLLATTDFFDDDVDLSDESDHESSSRFTLLDLTVQVVCDVASSGALETTFGACVEFVEEAVQFSHGQLNTRTIGYIVRFYFFIFYFGASSPTLSSDWPSSTWTAPGRDKEKGDFAMLNDPRESDEDCPYLPGGAPQAAAIAFKDLISLSIIRLGKAAVKSSVALAIWEEDSAGKENARPGLGALIDDVLSSVIGDAVDNVERANFAQIALHQVHKSGGSELFWYDMVNVCGQGMFGKDKDLSDAAKGVYVMIFALLGNVVKVASGKVRATNEGLLARDVSSKNLSLELLLHFIEYWSDEQEAVVGMQAPKSTHTGRALSTDTLAFAVRRLVVPCLLGNTKAAMLDQKIFRRTLCIVSELWRSPVNRAHCRAELGILMNHFFVQFLQLGPQFRGPKFKAKVEETFIGLHGHQLDILKALKGVFVADPLDAVLMFLNYDSEVSTDSSGTLQPMPGTKWNLFQKLCSALTSLAEKCGEAIANQVEEHRSKINSTDDVVANGINSDTFSNAEKTAIRESAKKLRAMALECITLITRSLAICAGVSVGGEYATLLLSWGDLDTAQTDGPKLLTNGEDERALTIFKGGDQQLVPYEPKRDRGSTKELEVAMSIAKKRGLKKAVDYLIACGVLTPAPRAIALYLRMHKNHFDAAELGRYLGESGIEQSEKEYWDSIRHYFVRAISFVGMTLDEALRHFLTHCGFLLPGEAQKVDRIMNSFAECFFEDNAGDVSICPFPTEDEIYLLSFAVILLNTDLHKVDKSQRRKRMSKQDFINNIRGSKQGEKIPKDYLVTLYESIEKNPIEADYNPDGDSRDREHRKREIEDILKNVQGADSLLRGLAVHDFRFATVEDVARHADSSPEATCKDLTKTAMDSIWHLWHSIVNTCLETAHLDLQGMHACADILIYSLTTSVCLELPTQKAAFLGQLGKLKSFEELRQGRWVEVPDYEAFRSEEWFLELEEACSGTVERRCWALRNIREWMTSVQTELIFDVRNRDELTKEVSDLESGDCFLQDPARSFLRRGLLTKRSGRTGRMTEYEFFLFSDILIYARKEAEGKPKLKIHEELPLRQLKVTDYFPESQKSGYRMFELHHPRKTFSVFCQSSEEKKAWVSDIRDAITTETSRAMKLEAARLAVHTKARPSLES